MFTIDDPEKLSSMMAIAVKHGCRLLEIPYLLCQLPWQQVAEMAKKAGLTEISLCHFWPINPDGSSVCGDPLGDEIEVQKSLATISQIIDAIRILRENGVKAKFIDGPLWGGLGRDYPDLTAAEKKTRVISFLRKAGSFCRAADVFMAVEFLRPEEDRVVGGTIAMMEILDEVNLSNVGLHFDVFHSLRCGEDPVKNILHAWGHIIYLHLHGNDRRAPGSSGETCDWNEIVKMVKKINSAVTQIPVVCEPFGEETCEENAALGVGLPPALPLDEYLALARKTFLAAGLIFT